MGTPKSSESSGSDSPAWNRSSTSLTRAAPWMSTGWPNDLVGSATTWRRLYPGTWISLA